MLPITLDPEDPRPLVEQIVGAIRQQIDERRLRPGTRMPSIRKLATSLKISRFTAVEAYDRLVALGYLTARRGAGFFTTASREDLARMPAREAQRDNKRLVSFIRAVLDTRENRILAGGPWLPNEWLEESGIQQSLRALTRKSGAHLIEYGNPYGYGPLRDHIALLLSEQGINADPAHLVLTHGTSQALDLIMRRLIKPGDAVLVEDPGYYNLFGNLRQYGARLLAVPRNPDGPNLSVLEELAAAHRPRVFFTQSALQNPTGTDMSPHVAFRVLQIAEQFDLTVVEDDIFCDLQTRSTPRLAALDQCNRVIYTRSFSKTLSGSLRVGFLAARRELADEIAEIKMLSSVTTSQFVERTLYSVLIDGQYRKYVSRLHKKLGEARLNVARAFDRFGVELFAESESSMFLWGRFPDVEDSLSLADSASAHGVMIAPGAVFRPHLETSPWMRFNITTCDDPAVHRWLEHVAARQAVSACRAAEQKIRTSSALSDNRHSASHVRRTGRHS
jgi:DNA-binding transcriptional MocR family regulator